MNETPLHPIGIDLGTSHCALSWTLPQSKLQAELLEIPQLEGPGQIFASTLLPSVLYIPAPHEIAAGDRALPWDPNGQSPIVGRWARDLAQHAPDRAILSSKSWLCYGGRGADIKEPMLPHQSSVEGRRTPRETARDFLAHMRAAWNERNPGLDAGAQHLVLTVPASFDLLAREWTEAAAREAGWQNLTLLEEPLAAFYAWLADQGDQWRKQLSVGDLVLVCDVGGGTSDFSLIAVSTEDGELRLDRIAVGRHLLLGGDNMDLSLAYHLQQKHELNLDTWQFQALVHQARLAKEALLGSTVIDEHPIAVAGRGSNLFAQTLSLMVTRQEVAELLIEGFFPVCELSERVPRARSQGLRELGLPYEKDPAITRQLSTFLQEAQANVRASAVLQQRLGELWSAEHASLLPTHVLFNGGVFHAPPLRQRLTRLLQHWTGNKLQILENPSYDHAVAYGAASFAAIKAEGRKLRVRSGAARSYYLGIESNEPAIPGRRPLLQGLCVLPQGTEEGLRLSLPEQAFGLWTGDEVSFRLFSASDRAGDQLGELVRDAESQLEELTLVSCRLTAPEGHADDVLPVYLTSELTELGTMQLAMQHIESPQNWQLEFHLSPQHA